MEQTTSATEKINSEPPLQLHSLPTLMMMESTTPLFQNENQADVHCDVILPPVSRTRLLRKCQCLRL